MKTRIIEVAGKKYTLTARRSIIKTIADICPELLDLGSDKNPQEFDDKVGFELGVKVMSELDVLFYDMIKVAHPEITKEKSDDILESFENEYNDVQANLLKFAMSVFTEGNPSQSKKNLNW